MFHWLCWAFSSSPSPRSPQSHSMSPNICLCPQVPCPPCPHVPTSPSPQVPMSPPCPLILQPKGLFSWKGSHFLWSRCASDSKSGCVCDCIWWGAQVTQNLGAQVTPAPPHFQKTSTWSCAWSKNGDWQMKQAQGYIDTCHSWFRWVDYPMTGLARAHMSHCWPGNTWKYRFCIKLFRDPLILEVG